MGSMYFICCKILGVAPGSDEETIKSAYRRSAKELHPDVNTSEKAGEYFIILRNAYEYLLNHKYSDDELKILWQEEYLREMRKGRQSFRRPGSFSGTRDSGRETLRDLLKKSGTARVLFIVFHFLFIFTGIWLLTHSVSDWILHEPAEGVNPFSAYLTLIFGFIMGLFFTSLFLITGISYLRNR